MWDKTHMNHVLLILAIALLQVPDALTQLNRFKISKSRASSKFSLNPLKPFMKFVRDPLKASAQRHYPKYLPPPPNMFQQPPPPPQMQQAPSTPHRVSTPMASVPWYRYYSPPPTKVLPPSTISLMPPMTALPSSLVFSSLSADRHYKPTYHAMSALSSLPSDIQIKTLRLPSRYRKPSVSSNSNLNLADSVVRQLLDYPNQESMPSVLVIEDPDVSTSPAAVQHSDMYSDLSQKPTPTIFVAPPITASGGDISDSSADLSMSNSASSNPDVFVIVSKNSKNRGLFGNEEKKNDLLTSPSTSSKMKKYKISTTLDDFGNPSASRQVWIIKR